MLWFCGSSSGIKVYYFENTSKMHVAILKFARSDIRFYLCFFKSCVLMPANGPQGRKMYHSLTKLIQFVVVDGDTYVSIGMLHHSGMNSTKTVTNPVTWHHTKKASIMLVHIRVQCSSDADGVLLGYGCGFEEHKSSLCVAQHPSLILEFYVQYLGVFFLRRC
jgi:hypothetical protein